VVLVQAPDEKGGLVVCPTRARDVLLSRMLSGSLDRRLAAGELPESGRLLAIRARHLASPEARNETSEAWGRLLARSSKRPSGRTARMPLCRKQISAARRDIEDLISLLGGSGPVASQGVATANAILRDGRGPVWSPLCPVDLRTAIRQAIACLNPPIFGLQQVDRHLQ
jgi:hypothetical protein